MDHSDDDTRFGRLIAQAREWLEQRLEMKFITQTWELVFDTFPLDEVQLPFGPVQSIVSVNYYDGNGNLTLLGSSNYYLDNVSRDPWIFPTSTWPSSVLSAADAIIIRFICGYTDATLVPMPIKAAITLKVKELYDEINSDKAIENLITTYYRQVA